MGNANETTRMGAACITAACAAAIASSTIAAPAPPIGGAPATGSVVEIDGETTGDVVRMAPEPLGETGAFLRALRGEGTSPPNDPEPPDDAGGGEPRAPRRCFESVQGRIAWNAEGDARWAPSNVERLCRGASHSLEPGRCFETALRGDLPSAGEGAWTWRPAVELCAGTRDARRALACYRARVTRFGDDRDAAIGRCRRPPFPIRESLARALDRLRVLAPPTGSRDTAASQPALEAPQLAATLDDSALLFEPAPTLDPVLHLAPEALAGLETVHVASAPVVPSSDVAIASSGERIARYAELGAQTADLRARLPARDDLVDLLDWRFEATPPDAIDAGSTTPANAVLNQPVDLLAGLELAADAVGLAHEDVLRIHHDVYPDANRQSGVFYYFPSAYVVAWDPSRGGGRGLGLRISYARAGEDGDDAEVRMAVMLDAGVDLAEIELARDLLRLQSERRGFVFRELAAFPLSAPPAVSLIDDLQSRFDLDPEQIAVNAMSTTLDRIELSWTTDPITAENIRLALREDFGVNGAAQFSPPNEGGPTPLIPINIRIDDAETYGRIGYELAATPANLTPFPLVFRHLHALVLDEARKPKVYSWSLGAAQLPAAARAEMDRENLPDALGARARRMWVAYALDQRCESCVRDTIEASVIANVWPETATLEIRALTPLAATGAELLEVRTRSRFFEPDIRELQSGPSLLIEGDGDALTIEPIFLGDRARPESGEAWPLFEYAIDAILPSGEVVPGVDWLASNDERVFVGEHQVRLSTGAFGAEP